MNDTQADAYYDEDDMGTEELDLSFLDDDKTEPAEPAGQEPKK